MRGSRPITPPVERFWAKVVIAGPTDCWMWQAATDACGYGWFRGENGNTRAHTFSYQLAVGPVPAGLHLDHVCRNKSCVNPAHLEPVTPAENNRRMQKALGIGRYATHCKNGHAFTPDNTYRNGQHRVCATCHRAAVLRWHSKIDDEQRERLRIAHDKARRKYLAKVAARRDQDFKVAA